MLGQRSTPANGVPDKGRHLALSDRGATGMTTIRVVPLSVAF
jgi:hypothetical protein